MAPLSLAEKLDKIRSPNLQSQQQTAVVLQAIESTLEEQNTELSPTAYFAALLALLSPAADNGDSAQKDVATPAVYLLSVVAPFAPQPLLRAKFTQILALLAPQLLREDADAPLLRPSIGCLETLLLAQDSASWELSAAQIGPRRAVSGLLGLSLDHRPKVRKQALEALKKVLASPPPGPSLDHPAAGMCAESAMTTLRDLAEKAVRARKDKNNTAPLHDPSQIHALQLVRAIASSSGGWPSKKIESLCELLLGIARTGNDYLTVAVFHVFEVILEGMADETASSKLPRLLDIITELRPAQNDAQLLPPWIAILSRAYDVSGQVEPDQTFYNLPAVFELVSEFLQSPSENIRISASECLVSFLENCVPSRILVELSVYDEKVLSTLAVAAESLLTVKYQAAWAQTCSVLGAMFDSLRWRAHPFLFELAKKVGEMRSIDSFSGKKEADKVIGKAIRAMGPEEVLQAVPLNLVSPSKTQPGRAWLLPLLRDYVSNTNLAHFKSAFVPLSQSMFERVQDHSQADKTMEIKIYETVVQQIWSILPGYCDLPLDLQHAFDREFAELLANLLYQRVEQRVDICRALQTLVDSNQAIASIEGDDDLALQSRVSQDTAKKNLEYLGQFAGNLLAVLFNVYVPTLPQSREPILQAINSYLSITPQPALVDNFGNVCKHLQLELAKPTSPAKADSAQRTEEQLPSMSHALLDLVTAMSAHLPRESFPALFDIVPVVIFRGDDPQLQKKAYKLVTRLAESAVGREALAERQVEVQALLAKSADSVSAPARRERLSAIAALLPVVPDTALHFIPSVLSEVVICCKEQNERARTMAFDLLVLMGRRMISASGAVIDNSKVPHMPDDAPAATASIVEYFTMVSAGLAGSTPHMVSASITAITRILYEFREVLDAQVLTDMVQTMDLFLTSNNREMVRSVLGFVKVCSISLPTEMMQPRLASLIPNLMVWSHEHKGHFRSKVKHILDRMVRRFGFETVNKYCPEADRKLISNIRKAKERSKRQKAAAKEAGEEDGNGAEQKTKHAGRFESEYDQALYSSDDGSDESDDSDREVLGKARRRGPGQSKAYIVEDENEPLDLLDPKALGSISSTKPVKLRKPARAKAKTNADGKLVLGRDSDDEDAMEIDKPGGEEDGGVDAYVAALKGKDAPKKGLRGKLKWSNKRGQGGDDDDEMDDAGAPAAAVKAKLDKSARRGPVSKRGSAKMGGGRGGNRGGRGVIQPRRRGLGEEKTRGPSRGGGIRKISRGRRR